MALSKEQLKDRIRNVAKENNADARILMRIYMMERFLERVSHSKYADSFIIKGGILVTSMVGVSMRSTMDVDTTIRNLNLSEEGIVPIIKEICEIDMDDDVLFEIKEVSSIMDEMEYPGIRININAMLESMVIIIKIDISTDDVITPKAVEYEYDLMLEDRSIKLWSYNLETILAEKLQTILSRGVLNTRMRDFYDIYVLFLRYRSEIDYVVLKEALEATCIKRNTISLKDSWRDIVDTIENDAKLNILWESYQRKYSYAEDIRYKETIQVARGLLERIM